MDLIDRGKLFCKGGIFLFQEGILGLLFEEVKVISAPQLLLTGFEGGAFLLIGKALELFGFLHVLGTRRIELPFQLFTPLLLLFRLFGEHKPLRQGGERLVGGFFVPKGECFAVLPCNVKALLRAFEQFACSLFLFFRTNGVRMRRHGGRSPFEAADLPLEGSHFSADAIEAGSPFPKGSLLLCTLIEAGNTLFPFLRGGEGSRTALFLPFEGLEPLSERGIVFFAHLGKGFEARCSKFLFVFCRRTRRVRALDQVFAVLFQIEEPRDELEPFCPRRTHELRKFPLRQGDTLFKIFLFEADDALQKRIALGNPFRADEEPLLHALVDLDGLGSILTLEFALDAKDAAAPFKRDLKFKADIGFVAGKIDAVPDRRGTGTGDLSVQRKADAVQNGALARAGISEDAEDPVLEEPGKVDDGGFGKGIDPAKFQFQRFHAPSPKSSRKAVTSSPPGCVP